MSAKGSIRDMAEDNGLFGGIVNLGLVLVIVVLGLVAGMTASTGDYRWVALLAAGAGGLLLALVPALLFWVTVATGILVAGTMRLYMPELQLVRWLLPVGAWVLAGYTLGYLVYFRLLVGRGVQRPLPVPGLVWWALLFVAVLLISGLLHWSGAGELVRGAKGYFQMWGLLFALAFYPWPIRMIDRIPIFLLIAAWLQLPFVVHQYLFLVPARAGLGDGVVAVDIIVGTFGGQADGGGDNAVLALFLMIVFAGLLSAWRQGVLSLSWALLLGLPLLLPIVLNMAKISVFYALIVFLVLFASDIARRPQRFVASLVLFAGVLAVLATAYTAFAPKELDTWGELIEFTYQGNVAADTNQDGELTRAGSLRYWLEMQQVQSLQETLFGQGPGSTRAEEDALEDESFGNPIDSEIKVGRLAVTAVLWEGGVLAFLVMLGLFVSAYLAAGRLFAKCTEDPMRRAMLHATQVAIALLFASLWHKHFFVFQIGYQTVFVLVFGYLAYWLRHLDRVSGKPPGNGAAVVKGRAS